MELILNLVRTKTINMDANQESIIVQFCLPFQGKAGIRGEWGRYPPFTEKRLAAAIPAARPAPDAQKPA
jgi:hypothetical protein